MKFKGIPEYSIIVYEDKILLGPTFPFSEIKLIYDFLEKIGAIEFVPEKEDGYMVLSRKYPPKSDSPTQD